MRKQWINHNLTAKSEMGSREWVDEQGAKGLSRSSFNFEQNVMKQITYNDYVQNGKQSIGNNEEVMVEQDLLSKHKEAMERLINLNLLFASPQTTNIKQQILKRKHLRIFKEVTLDNYIQLRLRQLQEVKPALVKRFNSYLREQKYFYRFLQHLYHSYPHLVVHQLFKYLFYTWQHYCPSVQHRQSFSQSISMSNQISDKLLQKQLASQTHKGERYVESLVRVVKGLVTTVVLVMCKHWLNPLIQTSNILD